MTLILIIHVPGLQTVTAPVAGQYNHNHSSYNVPHAVRYLTCLCHYHPAHPKARRTQKIIEVLDQYISNIATRIITVNKSIQIQIPGFVLLYTHIPGHTHSQSFAYYSISYSICCML